MYVVICVYVCVCMWRFKVNFGFFFRLFNICYIEVGFVVLRVGCLVCLVGYVFCRFVGFIFFLDWDRRWFVMFIDVLYGFWGVKFSNRYSSYRVMFRVFNIFLWIMKFNKTIYRIFRNLIDFGIFYIKWIYLRLINL